MLKTDFTRLVNIRYPIIQAGMAGGATTPTLVAAVSNAGGLGTLGAGYLTPDQLKRAIQEIKQLTQQPFAVNLFVPQHPNVPDESIQKMTEYLHPIRVQLGIDPNPPIGTIAASFEEQIQVLLEEQVPVFSSTFGIVPPDVIQSLKKQGTIVIGTATTVNEAIRLEEAGIDAVVAQGSDAGGHRGTFLKDAEDSLIGTMSLIPQVADHVSIPVIASGGIMDGRGLIASLVLGAAAVQMGTIFLACPESGIHEAYKKKLLASHEDETELTCAYSGKAARGIQTEFMKNMKECPSPIPEYPVQNALTQDIRRQAAKNNNPEYMSLWAGQGLRMTTDHSAEAIIQQIVKQAKEWIHRI